MQFHSTDLSTYMVEEKRHVSNIFYLSQKIQFDRLSTLYMLMTWCHDFGHHICICPVLEKYIALLLSPQMHLVQNKKWQHSERSMMSDRKKREKESQWNGGIKRLHRIVFYVKFVKSMMIFKHPRSWHHSKCHCDYNILERLAIMNDLILFLYWYQT